MKGILGEFKKFIMRGNVIDLAVGVIIGGAFQAIVNSLVNDIVSPVLSLATKGVNLADKFVVLTSDEVAFATVDAAKEAGYATLNYGGFITAIINFIIMAFVIFLLVSRARSPSSAWTRSPSPRGPTGASPAQSEWNAPCTPVGASPRTRARRGCR